MLYFCVYLIYLSFILYFQQIRFTGRKGSSGDVALDDIFILPDSCDEPIVTTPPPTEMRKLL